MTIPMFAFKKYVPWIGPLSICLFMGWLIYPSLVSLLPGVANRGSEDGGKPVSKLGEGGPDRAMTSVEDFSDPAGKDLPPLVTLRRNLEISGGGQPGLILKEGTEVRVKSLSEGGHLTVSPVDDDVEGIIPADATDLAMRIVEQRNQQGIESTIAGNDAPGPEAGVRTPTPVDKVSSGPTRPTAAVVVDPPQAGIESIVRPGQSEFARQAEIAFPLPRFPPLLEAVNQWRNVPRNAYPKTVSIKVPLNYKIYLGGEVVGRGQLPKGSLVVPNELAGATLKVSTVGANPNPVSIGVSDTDFKERVVAHYEKSVKARTELILAKRSAEEKRLAKAAAHEEALGSYNKGDDPRFDAVRESLRQGDAGFYQLEDASKWRWAGQETIDGTEYLVAYVMMTSESVFGVVQRELKALLHDHKIIKWIDVSSGQEL